MIAPLRTKPSHEDKPQVQPHDQQRFLQLLPRIQRQAERAFRGLPATWRQELTAETVAAAYILFVRLVSRGKGNLAYATPLATFAIRQVCAGRRLGKRANAHDIMSPHARVVQGIVVERLNSCDKRGVWHEVLVEDRRATPAEIAAARIDIAAWISLLSPRNRGIAIDLGMGEAVSDVARRYALSRARVSQIRKWLATSWERFQAGDGSTSNK